MRVRVEVVCRVLGRVSLHTRRCCVFKDSAGIWSFVASVIMFTRQGIAREKGFRKMLNRLTLALTSKLIRFKFQPVIPAPSHSKKWFPVNTTSICLDVIKTVNVISPEQQTFIRFSTISIPKIHKRDVVITIVFFRNPVLLLDHIFISLPPGYLTAFQIRKMPDQYRITLMNSHNFNWRKILP